MNSPQPNEDNVIYHLNASKKIESSVVFLLLTMAAFFTVPVPAAADAWLNQRQTQREARTSFLAQLEANQNERAAAAEARLRLFFDQIEREKLRPEAKPLWYLIAGLHRLDPDRVGDLPERVREIAPPRKESSRRKPRADPAFEAALEAAREDLTQETYSLLRRAAAVGEVQAAVELMRQVLWFDPDHGPIRKALGQVRLADKYADQIPRDTNHAELHGIPELADLDPEHNWFSPFDAKMVQQGLVWNRRYGWMPIKNADRYDKGYVYDLQRKTWDTAAGANAAHGKPGRDWIIRTQHVEVRGTANLDKMAQVADDLEAMYDEIFAVYAAFFADGKHDPLKLALGLVDHDPLVVWVYQDRQEYLDRTGAMQWSAGIFRPSNGTSYFYGGPSAVMYHEFTHQVLHVMTGKNSSPVWLTESIAEYTETAKLTPDGIKFSGAGYTEAMSLEALLELSGHGQWSQAMTRTNGANYAAAGSLATFCMKAEDGRYAADFIDFLRDSYRGRTRGRKIWEYLGLNARDFNIAYVRWGRSARR